MYTITYASVSEHFSSFRTNKIISATFLYVRKKSRVLCLFHYVQLVRREKPAPLFQPLFQLVQPLFFILTRKKQSFVTLCRTYCCFMLNLSFAGRSLQRCTSFTYVKEHFLSYWTNSATFLYIGKSRVLYCCSSQGEAPSALHLLP